MRIIYIRTSTTEQNPELQLQDISTIINLNDCICLKEQESAFKSEAIRPELDKIKNLIKNDN